MATYDFKFSLLSAEKTGYPNLIGTSLSSTGYTITGLLCAGITVLSLSTFGSGLLFNSVPILSAFTSAQLSSFTTARLSAASLSVYGLNYVGSLSRLPGLTATSLQVLDNAFMINNAYAGKTFGLIRPPMVDREVTIFIMPPLSALSAVSLGSFLTMEYYLVSATTTDVITPETTRKHMLGYY